MFDEKILIVDDELAIIQLYQVQLDGQFQIEIADSAESGIKMLEDNGEYAVVVSDMHMPGMDGTEFLGVVQERYPEAVRVMLTANNEQQVAVEAVNEGQIFRFLNKPCPTERLGKTLEASIQQFRLLKAEKELLDKTLSGAINLLTDMLSVAKPLAYGRAIRVRRLVEQMMQRTEVESGWELTLAAMLSQVGCVSLSDETLEKLHDGRELNQREREEFEETPVGGSKLIGKIPRLERIAELIRHQNTPWSELKEIAADQPLLGRAALLHVALDYDRLTHTSMPERVVLQKMENEASQYAGHAVTLLQTQVESTSQQESRKVSVMELEVGMILERDVIGEGGQVLVTMGQEITELLKERLARRASMIAGEISVTVNA